MTSSRLKRAVVAAATSVWSGSARMAGRYASARPTVWRSTGGQRVLVVAPHPDDEMACAGAVILHRLAGDEVHVAHVTDGRASRAGGLAPDEMAERRREEARAATAELRVSGHWLGLREREWEEASLLQALRQLLEQTQPHILYAPSRVDFHPEHLGVALGLARALASAPLPPHTIRAYEVQVPLTPVLINLVAPIQAAVPELVAVMMRYQTQVGSIERCLRMKRYGASFYGLTGLAEVFWEVSAEAYGRVHAVSVGRTVDGRFRGVRAHPFADPLAYLRGLGARRALRDLSVVS